MCVVHLSCRGVIEMGPFPGVGTFSMAAIRLRAIMTPVEVEVSGSPLILQTQATVVERVVARGGSLHWHAGIARRCRFGVPTWSKSIETRRGPRTTAAAR